MSESLLNAAVPQDSGGAPKLVVLAGPNGAGKSTSARAILKDALRVDEFVNADTIAQGLSAFDPSTVGISAGRIMLARLRELAAAQASFAFETTLASRSFAPWISRLIAEGYEFHLVFLWLPSADAAVQRVIERVRRGGHSVPEGVARRRFKSGIANFSRLYMPMATQWQVFDNRGRIPRLIARGASCQGKRIFRPHLWEQFLNSIIA